MRIACLQFAPKLGDVDNNLNRADAVLSKANPADLDLLVLPELAFTGFNFSSLQQITPFLEPKGSGITSLWARTVALKYDCVVCAGYPEMVDVSQKWPTGPEYYNSTIVVNGEGETIGNYRKTFLYTDETWALEGPKGFFSDIIPGLGNTAIGICTDLNPYKFEAPWHAFEFAYHILRNYSNLVILTMAWITREDGQAYSQKPHEPDLETLTYWITRLEPLIRSENQDEIIVVFCNRTGSENEATYSGTSTVLGILDGEVHVYGMLGRGERNLLVVDTNNPPRAKMVYRPEEDEEQTRNEVLLDMQRHIQYAEPDVPPVRQRTESKGPPTARSTSTRRTARSPRPQEPPRSTEREAHERRSSSKKRQKSMSRSKARDLSIKTGPKQKDDDGGIPTPSAPSPTPMAMRPRLQIPDSAKSPPIQPMDDFSEPPSAASLRSYTSSMSTNSYMSKASQSTVRSFARPPEDSTPYPHSSVPRSARVFSPTTAQPFSPDTAQPFPSSGAEHSTGTTVTFNREADTYHERQYWSPSPKSPEAFIWPPTRLESSHSQEQEEGASTYWDHLRQQDNSSARTRERKAAARKSGGSMLSEGTAKFFSGSTPPGSRSASRDRARHSGIDMGMMDPAVAFVHHTAHLIPGADMAERIRALTGGTDSPIPDRPASPKSRNASRSRPSGTSSFQRSNSSTIPIFASPSLIGGNTSVDDLHRGRAPEPQEVLSPLEDIHHPPLPSSGLSDYSFASRGEHYVSTGQPFSREQQLSSAQRQTLEGQRGTSSSNHPDFERVEEVVRDNCPVHGQGSRAVSVVEPHTQPQPSPPPLRPATLPLNFPRPEPDTR